MELKFRVFAEYDGGSGKGNKTKMFYFEKLECDNGLWFKVLDYVYCIIRYHSVMQFTGIYDKNNKNVFADDILEDEKGNKFRVYSTIGGFAIKGSVWKKNLKDEVGTDELIWQPLPDAQTRSYINKQCKVIGNIHENSKLIVK